MGKDLKGKELGKGIYQRKDGYYTARFVDRYGRRIEKYFKKLQECRYWLEDAKYEDRHSNVYCPKDLSVNGFFDYWIEVKEKTVRPNTVRNYRDRYNQNIRPVIGDMILNEVLPTHCQLIFNIMDDEEYCTSTLKLTRITLTNLMNHAVSDKIISENPCNKTVKSNMGKSEKKIKPLTIEGQTAFLKYALRSEFYEQFAFILQTGLRAGEMIGLKWSDINFKNRTLNIERTMEYDYSTHSWKVGPPKRKSSIRTIPLTNEAIVLLKKQKAFNKTLNFIHMEFSDLVFLSRNGEPIKNSLYDRYIYSVCDMAIIPRISMHTLRHTFATRCIEAGMKPKTLQKILGHSKISTTMDLYVDITEEEKTKEISSIEEFLKFG